jgi:hypothetical protein
MNKSFSVIKGNVGAEIIDTSTTFATILGKIINRRYFQILRAVNWQNINYSYTFNTVAGTQRYALPDDFSKEISCADTTNDTVLNKTTLDELVRNYQDLDDSGTVQRYAIIEDCVKAQPTAASALAIVSSSASDTTQTVLVRGIVSGAETYESVTLTGTTPANTTKSYTRIKGISKSAATTGYVTITSNSAAVTNAVIPGETLETRYKLALLHYIPSSIYTISMPYVVSPLPLSQDYDYPVIDVGDLIEIGALADAWRYKRQFTKAQTMEILFNQQLQEYIFDKENQPNMIYQFKPEIFNRDDTV